MEVGGSGDDAELGKLAGGAALSPSPAQSYIRRGQLRHLHRPFHEEERVS